MKKKLTYKLKTKLPRGKIPPPAKIFKDKKKENNKTRCRKKVDELEENC